MYVKNIFGRIENSFIRHENVDFVVEKLKMIRKAIYGRTFVCKL